MRGLVDSKTSLAHNYAQDHFWHLALSSPPHYYEAETGDLLARLILGGSQDQDGGEEDSSVKS